jgi:hypothetical protein
VADGGYWDGSVEDVTYNVPWDQCLRFTKPTRWRGLWEVGFEWSEFCPAPATKCPIAAQRGGIWLDFADGAYKGPRLSDGLFEVEFTGRRTVYPGNFGHLGMYAHEMIVDRMISIKQVPDRQSEAEK